MPFSPRARRAAGAELSRRQKGTKKTKKSSKRRPLGSASQGLLRHIASNGRLPK